MERSETQPKLLSLVQHALQERDDTNGMKEASPVVAELPFSSVYKLMATIHEPLAKIDGAEYDGKYVVYAKGVPDRMVQMCSTQAKGGMMGEADKEPINKEYWMNQVSILSSYGLCVLALCRAEVNKDEVKEGEQLKAEFLKGRGQWLTMIGLCAIMNPPHPESFTLVT